MVADQVAEESPSDIFTISVDRQTGLTDADTAKLAEALGFASEPARQNARDQMQRLYAMFIDKDATQVEINPLVETPEHKVYCVDAKINFDDNAAFRHKDVFAQRDFSMEYAYMHDVVSGMLTDCCTGILAKLLPRSMN